MTKCDFCGFDKKIKIFRVREYWNDSYPIKKICKDCCIKFGGDWTIGGREFNKKNQ